MPDLDQLCADLFDAFVVHHLDAVGALLADDAVITQNGNSMPWSEARPLIAALADVVRDHRDEDVRCVVGDDALVEEHTVVGESPSGRPLRLAACAVVRVDAAGRIVTIDEHVDVPDFG